MNGEMIFFSSNVLSKFIKVTRFVRHRFEIQNYLCSIWAPQSMSSIHGLRKYYPHPCFLPSPLFSHYIPRLFRLIAYWKFSQKIEDLCCVACLFWQYVVFRYESVLMQEMLTFVIQLVKERRFCGLSTADNLKRELIYKLAIGDATHSQIVKSLPRDLSSSDQLQNVLDSLAVYSNPCGMKQVSLHQFL